MRPPQGAAPKAEAPALAPQTPGEEILLALSGGVDSAVAARLLIEAGWRVRGLCLRFSPAHQTAVEKARKAAEELGIPLEVLPCEAEFEALVIRPFCEMYAGGRTPNPCVECNPTVKFALLARQADRLGIRAIASGHYARLSRAGETVHVAVAASAARDQSYMLYRLPQALLARLVLPLGGLEKGRVRALAADMGLSSANAPDSQEICFIPSGGHAAYIEARGYPPRGGRFIGPAGEDLGPHGGLAHYTVGQRKGLGLSLGYRAYVQSLLPNGDVRLARSGEGDAAGLEMDRLATPDGRPLVAGGVFEAKIRSTARPARCTVTRADAAGAALRFDTPQFGVAPGQHCVLYSGPLVAGGGQIIRAVFTGFE